jgi:hypothetical protein
MADQDADTVAVEGLHRTVVLIRLSLGEIDRYLVQLRNLRDDLTTVLHVIDRAQTDGGCE